MRPSHPSRRTATEANEEAGAASSFCASSTAPAARSGDFAGVLLEGSPGLVAVFALPLLVEAGGFQLGAERLLIDRRELHALGSQVGFEGRILLGDVLALHDGR